MNHFGREVICIMHRSNYWMKKSHVIPQKQPDLSIFTAKVPAILDLRGISATKVTGPHGVLHFRLSS